MPPETGILNTDPADVVSKGRLQPGKMFLVDLEEHRIIEDEEIKQTLATRRPYIEWLRDHAVRMQDLPDYGRPARYPPEELHVREKMFGYTLEDERLLMKPMGLHGKEALGSMGDDTPLAVLSDKSRLLYDYFRQLFAQVTNPPLDAIREEMVTSLFTQLGAELDLFKETPQHCRKLILKQPILSDRDLARIPNSGIEELKTQKIDIVFDTDSGGEGLRKALDHLCEEAERLVREGWSVLVVVGSGCRSGYGAHSGIDCYRRRTSSPDSQGPSHPRFHRG